MQMPAEGVEGHRSHGRIGNVQLDAAAEGVDVEGLVRTPCLGPHVYLATESVHANGAAHVFEPHTRRKAVNAMRTFEAIDRQRRTEELGIETRSPRHLD